jgi:hypothetical protein
VGVHDQVVFPVGDTGRTLNGADDPAALVDSTADSLVVWYQQPIRLRRFLGFADFVNVRGQRVPASAHSIDQRARLDAVGH